MRPHAPLLIVLAVALAGCGLMPSSKSSVVTKIDIRRCPADLPRVECPVPGQGAPHTLLGYRIAYEEQQAGLQQCRASLEAWRKAWGGCANPTND